MHVSVFKHLLPNAPENPGDIPPSSQTQTQSARETISEESWSQKVTYQCLAHVYNYVSLTDPFMLSFIHFFFCCTNNCQARGQEEARGAQSIDSTLASSQPSKSFLGRSVPVWRKKDK